MDLWQLKIFCKVIETRSFSGAGRAVHLSQPTVSSHIKELEDHFGCRLVDRLSREAVPTAAGEVLYDYARRLMALRDDLEAAIAGLHGKIRGRLAVGGSTIPGVYILPPLVGAFTARYSDVTISLSVGDTETVIEGVAGGRLELGVVGAKSADRRVRQAPLVDDRLCLVVPADHPWAGGPEVSLEALMAEPFIIREPGSGTLQSIRERLGQAGADPDGLRVSAEMGSTQAVLQGIKSGLGVSILSCVAVADAVAAGSVVTVAIRDLSMERRFYLTWHRQRTPSPQAAAFIDFLKETVPAETGEAHDD
jgi:DNA-binding transcriptional LysR family regulator